MIVDRLFKRRILRGSSFSIPDYRNSSRHRRNNARFFRPRTKITIGKDVCHLHLRKFMIEKGMYNTAPYVTHGSILFAIVKIVIAPTSTTPITQVNQSNKLTLLFTLDPILRLIHLLTSTACRMMPPQKNFITKNFSSFLCLTVRNMKLLAQQRTFIYRATRNRSNHARRTRTSPSS